jgi:hypothetical protein
MSGLCAVKVKPPSCIMWGGYGAWPTICGLPKQIPAGVEHLILDMHDSLVSAITVSAPQSPFLRKLDKGTFLWWLFGMCGVVGLAEGNYNVLASHLLIQHGGKNGEFERTSFCASVRHLSLCIQPRLIVGILCS